MMLSSMTAAMELLVDGRVAEEMPPTPPPAAWKSYAGHDEIQEPSPTPPPPPPAMEEEDYLADFLASVLFDDAKPNSTACHQHNLQAHCAAPLVPYFATSVSTTRADATVPMCMEIDDDSSSSSSSTSNNSDPLTDKDAMGNYASSLQEVMVYHETEHDEDDPFSPQDIHNCAHCIGGHNNQVDDRHTAACTGCGQGICLFHAYNDGTGGNGNNGTSPGGLMCVNCMVYHFY